MKIAIDARLFGTKHRGLGRYVERIIKHLEQIDQQNQYVVLLGRDNFDDYQPAAENFSKVLADFHPYSLKEQLFFPAALKQQRPDKVFFPHFNVPLLFRGRFVVVIHDLIISHYPDSRATTLNPWLYQLKLFFYRRVVASAVARAEKIIAVSEFTKQDIIKILGVSADKIQVIYEGVDQPAEAAPAPDDLLSKLKIKNNFLLYVGSAYPHKNLPVLLEAFKTVAATQSNCQLVLVGREDYFYQGLKKYLAENFSPVVQQKVVFTGYLPDNELFVLYQKAKLYVFPSLLEGFGLPPLEAQSQGLPVLSSSRSCLPEILGDSAAYFDPEQPRELADKINQLLNQPDKLEALAAAGKKNCEKYSWEKCAEEVKTLVTGNQ